MSSHPTEESIPRSTPIYEQTVTATAVHLDADPAATGSAPATAVKDAAGQAKDTAKQTAGVAKDQAQQLGSTAVDAGKRVGDTAKDQAAKVASNAVDQARDLYGQATEQLSEQAGKQQQNAAAALQTLSKELADMHARDENGGLAAELVQSVSKRAGRAADWLESRDPSEVLDEVKQFAARRPGLFIGLAAVAGIVASRAVKALTADAKSSPSAASATSNSSGIGDPRAARGTTNGYRVDGTGDIR